ncbi:signal recognition particle-docking protein FtsY [Cuniculiplasma sp. SKW4]|uniref:signal recognition particle-docking protein FtsY n=1 Tax=Cuniculiplasma sp. SKW4 TaxID=3400171 RepID=UPI003FD582CD
MSLRDKLRNIFSGRSDFLRIEELEDEFFNVLLESDVSIETTEYILQEFKKRAKEKKRMKRDEAMNLLKEILLRILNEAKKDFDFLGQEKKPFIILFIGINGTGKTTTVGKLSNYLLNNGKTVAMGASDTFRAGAIDQLKIHGENLGVRVIYQGMGSDPAAVAYDTIEHARARKLDYAIIDTAGRMQTNRNLMEEMKKIKRISKPDLTILTVDAMAANDAIEQASTFKKEIGFDGLIVNKMDTDARGGAIFSIAHQFQKPIYFIGVGQSMEDLIPYDPHYIINKIFS